MTKQSILIGMFCFCLAIESFFPLRKATQNKPKRVLINIAMAIMSTLIMKYIFFPVVLGLSIQTTRQHWGLIHFLQLSGIFAVILGFLFLDYTLYIWHFLNHKVPFFWRFHSVHHSDLDMDVSTASRFHFGELALSSFYRSLQVILFGIPPEILVGFETLVTFSAQFHHSNIKLPFQIEKLLVYFLVTPRMHGIHHSIVQKEADSNYCATLTIWDRLHRTLRLNVHQKEILIGIPQYRQAKDLTFSHCILLAFRKPKAWKLPNGTTPERRLNSQPQPLLLA